MCACVCLCVHSCMCLCVCTYTLKLLQQVPTAAPALLHSLSFLLSCFSLLPEPIRLGRTFISPGKGANSHSEPCMACEREEWLSSRIQRSELRSRPSPSLSSVPSYPLTLTFRKAGRDEEGGRASTACLAVWVGVVYALATCQGLRRLLGFLAFPSSSPKKT